MRYKRGILFDSVILQRPPVPIQTKLSDAGVMRVSRENRNSPVPFGAEVIHNLKALRLVVNRDNPPARQRLRDPAVYRTEHIRDGERLEERYVRLARSAHEDDPFQPPLPCDADGSHDFIFLLLNLLEDKCVVLALDMALGDLNHLGKQRIADALRDKSDRVGLRSFEILRAVVRNIVVFTDRIEDQLFRLRVDIRVIVDRTRYRADANLTDSRNVPDRYMFHTQASLVLSACTRAGSAPQLSGLPASSCNLCDSADPPDQVLIDRKVCQPPGPVAVHGSRVIHARLASESQIILHRNDACV